MPGELWLWQPGDTLGLEAKQATSWKQGEVGRLLHLFIHLFTSLSHRSHSPPAECQPGDRSSGWGIKDGLFEKQKYTELIHGKQMDFAFPWEE